MRANRLDQAEVTWLREKRLREIHMWAVIREFCIYMIFVTLLYLVTYSSVNVHGFREVQHLRKYFHNTRQPDYDFTQVRISVTRENHGRYLFTDRSDR